MSDTPVRHTVLMQITALSEPIETVDLETRPLIVDAGPGIPPGDRARLLRPFERGDASRSRDTGGVGLGLSIVQTFADLHDGTLSLDEAEGGGTIATLAVPALVQ